jgi:hypothetical protein
MSPSPLGRNCISAHCSPVPELGGSAVGFLVSGRNVCNTLYEWVENSPMTIVTDVGPVSHYTFDGDTATITASWALCGRLWIALETTHADPNGVFAELLLPRISVVTVVRNSSAILTTHNPRA